MINLPPYYVKEEGAMKNLAEIRKLRGITQNALAVKAGLTVTTISRLEHEHTGARFDTAVKIAKALNVNVEALIDEGYGVKSLGPEAMLDE